MSGSVDAANHYRQMERQTLFRLLLTYLLPLLLLAVYFNVEYRDLVAENTRARLLAVAENQAGTLDLFLRERVVNLLNLIDDPKLEMPPGQATVDDLLAGLKRDSSTFVDLGFFDAAGTMLTYSGPFPALLGRHYNQEDWFTSLLRSRERFVITDMYLGFRQRPHFTIAVQGEADGRSVALRATIDPERFYEYITTLKASGEVSSVLVNPAGTFQMVNLPAVVTEQDVAIVPPREPAHGSSVQGTAHGPLPYAYSWLDLTDWALLVFASQGNRRIVLGGFNATVIAISSAVILAVFSAILIRTRSAVRSRRREDSARAELSAQLHHAARLASVGELAAGVAHEINNPLAVIAEEAGLLCDLMDPELHTPTEADDFTPHLEAIQEAAYRARDITRKLLSFVRRSDVRPRLHDINTLLEDIVSGLLEHEMTVDNIEVVRHYGDGLPLVRVDKGELEQVVVNLVTNAIDAIAGSGRIMVATSLHPDGVHINVTDTGSGMTRDQMERIFMPFFTTKEVGRGTGLGLSVSYGIIKAYGGDIRVESCPGAGSSFTVVLPVEPGTAASGPAADRADGCAPPAPTAADGDPTGDQGNGR